MNTQFRSLKAVVAMLMAVLLCVPLASLHADDTNLHKGRFYISGGIAGFEGPDSSRRGYEDFEAGPGVVLGYGFADRWALEFLGARVDADFDNLFGSGSDDIDLTWANLLYHFDDNNGWQPFVLFGAGQARYRFDGLRPSTHDNQLNLGVGVFRNIAKNIALRADVRGVTSSQDAGLHPFAFVGLTAFFGGEAAAYARADADGDGVRNEIDQCPTTPPGRVVDATGCQLDSDGDGVVDGDDQCPDTPAGAAVNAQGCALDTDGDGVPDYRDECPDTERGAKVDDKGCYVTLEEQVTIDMNIEFETNKADIRPDQVSEINRAIKFLREYPTAQAVIEGHTDSSGAASYNQDLSEKRAKAVYDYMIGTAGIKADRLSWAGFGETRPIADNNTAAGKQRNRRVSAVVAGTQTVRQ